MRNLPLALILLIVLAAGCGNKQWPRPELAEESFAFTQVEGQRQGRCLLVRATVEGNPDAVGHVVVQIEEWDECQECPFRPSTYIEYRRGDPRLSLDDEGRLAVSYCDLDPNRPFRWRLAGGTRLRPEFTVTGPVMSANVPSSNSKE